MCPDCHRLGPNAIHRVGRATFEKFWNLELEMVRQEVQFRFAQLTP